MTSTLTEKYKIADENNRQISTFRPLPTATLKSLREYYRVGLTYTSNAIEGNSLTESETKVVIEDGLTIEGKPLRDVYEAVGHAKAYDYLLQLEEKEVLEEDDILTLHKLFYQQIDSEQAGRYRNVKVYISGSHYQVAPVAKIETEMKKLITWYNNNENKLHPIELAAELHRRFVFIHPFVDGNGRLARLLMNLSLLRNGYTLAIIPALLRHEYIATLEMAHKDSVPFYEFIADRVINTQYDLLRLLKDDDTVNDTVNDTVRDEVNALTATESAVLHAISGDRRLTYEQIAEKCGVSRPTVARSVKHLQQLQIIRRRGADKTGYWEIADNASEYFNE